MSSFSPVKWDQVTLDEVSFHRFPPKLKNGNYINLEQDRLDFFQDRPSTSIFSALDQSESCKISELIEDHNVLMMEVVKFLSRRYCQRTVDHLHPELRNDYIRKLLTDMVGMMNYLFGRKGYLSLDPLVRTDSTGENLLRVRFDVLTELDDPTGSIPSILYRNYLQVKLALASPIQMKIKGVGWAKRPVLPSAKDKVVNRKFDQATGFQQRFSDLLTDQISEYSQKCRKNDDCPYYQGNRNYPNNFGGCDTETGYCQMPQGVRHLTHRLPRNPREAVCGNCQLGDTDQCCQKQLVRSFYPRLASPDYRFEGDHALRMANREILATRGLLP
jgi:hypothetical protein